MGSSSLTMDQICPCIVGKGLDHWITREVPPFGLDSNTYVRAWVLDTSYAWKFVLRVFS